MLGIFVVWSIYLWFASITYWPGQATALSPAGLPCKPGSANRRREASSATDRDTRSPVRHLLRYASLGGNPTTIPATFSKVRDQAPLILLLCANTFKMRRTNQI